MEALNSFMSLLPSAGQELAGASCQEWLINRGKLCMQREAFPSVYSVELQYAGRLTMTAAIDQGPTMGKHCDKPLI